MSKNKSFIIVLTFFSLWIAVFFNENIENFLAYTLILSFGIIHGANDLKLIMKNMNTPTQHSFLKILSTYIFFVLLSSTIFYFFPLFALILFILFSAYHFGEEHLSSKSFKKNKLIIGTYFVHGLLIFSILFYTNSSEVSSIFKEITGVYPTQLLFERILYVTLFLLLVLFTLNTLNKTLSIEKVLEESFYILILYIVFNTASLVWSFAIYFVYWHSIPSLIRQVHYLYGNNKINNFKSYIKSSFIYWLLSIAALAIVYFFFNGNKSLFTPILFVMLASITFPHVWVISKLDTNY